MTGSARNQMSSISRSDNAERLFSEIGLRRLEEAGSMETFVVIVGETFLPVHIYARNGRH